MDKKRIFIVNVVFYSLILVILWAVCKFILPVLVPFIIAFVIASVLHAPVRKLFKNSGRGKRAVSVILTIAFFALFFSVLVVAGVKIADTVSGFLIWVPGFYTDELAPALSGLADNMEGLFSSFDPQVADQIVGIFEDFVNNFGNYITEFSVNAVKAISGSIVGIPSFVIKFIIMVISTFFFMLDYEKVLELCWKCVPEGKKEQVRNIWDYLKNSLLIYLRSYALLCLLTFMELSIGFAIMKIPYAPLVGLAVAIFDILPVLGTGGILMPWAVILFLMKNFSMGIGMLVLYLVITAIRNTLEPKLVGEQIGLHPLATLISMYLGLRLIGIWGMFLFPVTLTVAIRMKRDGKI